MASSSSNWKYDVFPSFSGEDVRKSFLSHLLEALKRKSIISFIDNGIERCHLIEDEILMAIRQSRISIVVLSRKYASSTWCLNELAEIHKCHEESDQKVIPIFYDVDPCHVSKQTGEFGEAFETACERKSEDDKKRWKKALEKVAGIAGYDSQNWSDEAKAIELIAKNVLNKLFTPSADFGDFVGIEAHIEKIMDSLLCLESEQVRMVGIVGPSGIGKSTIARALYSRLSSQFDHHAFVSYKRTIEDDFSMKLSWVEQFLSELLGQKDLKIESLGAVEQRLNSRKVLIVLDDVDCIQLLEALVGQTGWFGFGSRIIVVTQDRALLKSHEIDLIYQVRFPSENLALQIFCRSAFRQNSPPDGFLKLAIEVAYLAGNLPLGLSVLGSSLRGKNQDYWVEMMPRLRDGLNGKIEKTLRVCYEGLDEKDDQDMFLHIACLFNGESVNYIKNLLEKGSYNSVNSRLRTLADKSLLRITAPPETVQMHILLQKLGKEIVRAESINNPGKRRFLVDAKDISDVFNDNIGTENVLGIRLDISEIDESLFLNDKLFDGMRNLQFIKFYKEWWTQKSGKVGLSLPQGLVYLPRKLRLLHWEEYPWKYIPSSFSAEHLVELRMENSRLEKLWEGIQPLRRLKKMNVAGAKYLKEIPDLSNATNLEVLNLSGCTSLVTLPSSIRNLKNLTELRMARCSKLKVLPTDVNLETLNYLSLSECSKLTSFPLISRNISRLYLDGTAMKEKDCFWIENLSKLFVLEWKNVPLRCMPSKFHPEHLVQLQMRGSKLEKLWEGVQLVINLTRMDLKSCENLKEIPDLSKAIHLELMNLSGCESLREIPDLSKAISLNWVNLSGCKNLQKIPNLPKATNLWSWGLNNCISLNMRPSIQDLEAPPTNVNLVSLASPFTENVKKTKKIRFWVENKLRYNRQQITSLRMFNTSANIWNLKHLDKVDFTENTEYHSKDLHDYLNLGRSQTSLQFCDYFSLDGDVQELILQSDCRFAILPGKKVPTYFMHRTRGSSLIVPLHQSSLSKNILGFKACITLGHVTDFIYYCTKIIIVHWKFMGLRGMCNIDPGIDFCEMDHMVVFHFAFCPREEVHDPPSQLDYNNVELEFELHSADLCHCYSILGNKDRDLQTCPILPCKIEGCGVRVLNVFPSLVANDRSFENAYNHHIGSSKKPLPITVVKSQEHSNLPGGRTRAPNLDLSSGLSGASSNFHGDGTSLYHSLPPYAFLEGDSLCADPMIMEQQDTNTPVVGPSFSSRFLNFFRCWSISKSQTG